MVRRRTIPTRAAQDVAAADALDRGGQRDDAMKEERARHVPGAGGWCAGCHRNGQVRQHAHCRRARPAGT